MRTLIILAALAGLIGADASDRKVTAARFGEAIEESDLVKQGEASIQEARAQYAITIRDAYMPFALEKVPEPEVGPDPRQSEREKAEIAKWHNREADRLKAKLEGHKAGKVIDQEIIDLINGEIPHLFMWRKELGLSTELPKPGKAKRSDADVLGNPAPKPKLKATLADGTVVEQ